MTFNANTSIQDPAHTIGRRLALDEDVAVDNLTIDAVVRTRTETH